MTILTSSSNLPLALPLAPTPIDSIPFKLLSPLSFPPSDPNPPSPLDDIPPPDKFECLFEPRLKGSSVVIE